MLNKTAALLFVLILPCLYITAQTPVNMASQTDYSYTETFADIANWVFKTSPSADGTFTAGTGSAPFKGNATNATGAIPDGQKLTIASTSFASGNGGGVQKGTGALVLLATGATDNSSAVAVDFYLDFTGLSAGTLSFDWSSVNNSTGDRKASMKVYSSTDGITYTEITDAAVLNITNNSVTSGSITNVALPFALGGSATARLRFYIYNATGGTTGSRPKISLDNLKVTATSSVACTSPANQPTSLVIGTPGSTAFSGSFTAAASAPDHYIVLLSINNTLGNLPVNGTTYTAGDNIGDASVVSVGTTTSFSALSLSPATTYYVFIFAMNSQCSGGPLYNTTAPLTGSTTTGTEMLPCAAPGAQPGSMVFSNKTSSSLQGSFTAASGADEYLVVRSTSSSLSVGPSNGTTYAAGDLLGGGTVIARGSPTAFVTSPLNAATTYYFFVYSIVSQNCTGGPVYLGTSPLTANTTTLSSAGGACVAPVYQPGSLVLSGDNKNITGSFSNAVDADSYLVLYSTSASLSQSPVNGATYTTGATLGNATVASVASANSFYISNLNASTTYYIYVYAKNSSCSGGVKYNTASPLTGSRTTTATAAYNFYYGNMHAHSRYSDGNKDNASYTPADDYAYAKNSQGLDFLGLSEHNHSQAGMQIADWPLGLAQANAATTSTFLALYGQEWGVSDGGHVLVYGIDSLIGWETNNYQVYVAKDDYTGTPATTGTTGLFRTLNNQGNAFASYAHPGSGEYNNVSGTAYNATVDSAVIGSAVESGPAFSTNTTYSDYPSSMGYLSYYTKMLSKGYHIGPFMDHDTHYTNFGRANENRVVVLATSLTKANVYAAFKAKRFYATQDIDTKVTLTVNNKPMGSNFSGASSSIINVTATDPTSPSSTPSIKIMYGTPGSGVTAATLTSATAASLTYTDNSLVNGSSVYYYADITINGKRTITAPVWYTFNSCTYDENNPIATWIGGSGTATTTAANWCGGIVPPSGSNIIVSSTAATMPVLTGGQTFTVNNLTIQSGSTLTVNGGTLAITGVVSNSGSLDASVGTLEYNGTAAQSLTTLAGLTVQNLTINNAAGVSLNNSLAVTGTLTVTTGQFATNGNLTLKSSASGTAILAAVGGSITGNVTVERYIPSNSRKGYSMVSSPVSSPTLYTAWQEAGSLVSTGYGTQITGPAGTSAAQGFDATSASGLSSVFTYNDLNPTGSKWVGLTNTNVNTLATGKGFMVYIRGDRAVAPGSAATGNTVLRAKGILATGNFTFPSLTTGANKYTLVGNPYAAPVNWLSAGITKTQLSNSFTIYDANLGVFVTSNGTILSPSVSSQQQPSYIQPGQAFFVQNDATGTAPALSFTEAAKAAVSTASNVTVFGEPEKMARLNLNLYSAADSTFIDGAVAVFGKTFSAAVDGADAGKMNNFNETVSLQRNSHGLSIEARPLIQGNDSLFINLNSFGKKAYRIHIDGKDFEGATAVLEDRYTKTRTVLDLAGNTAYDFTIDGHAASAAADRFMVTFGSTAVIVNEDIVTEGISITIGPNPVSNHVTVNYKTTISSATHIRMVNSLGQVVRLLQTGNALQSSTRINTRNLPAGIYAVQLLNGDKVIAAKKLVKE